MCHTRKADKDVDNGNMITGKHDKVHNVILPAMHGSPRATHGPVDCMHSVFEMRGEFQFDFQLPEP